MTFFKLDFFGTGYEKGCAYLYFLKFFSSAFLTEEGCSVFELRLGSRRVFLELLGFQFVFER